MIVLRAIHWTFVVFFLAALSLAAVTIGPVVAGEDESGVSPGESIGNGRAEYNFRILFVSPSRLRQLARMFKRNERAGALAIWRQDDDGAPLGRCTIYLREGASYDMLAHEARHCFEGQYHPRTSHNAAERRRIPGLRSTAEDFYRR